MEAYFWHGIKIYNKKVIANLPYNSDFFSEFWVYILQFCFLDT